MSALIDKTKALLKTNRIDLIILVLTLFLILILIERPKGIANLHIKTDTSDIKEQADTNKEGESNGDQTEEEDTYKFIKERNIFAQDGKYFSSNVLQQLPEKPYNLVAIFKGAEKRALFRDYKGNMLFVKEGDKLIDDAVVEEIGITSVKVTKEDEKRELKVFDVMPKKDETKKNP